MSTAAPGRSVFGNAGKKATQAEVTDKNVVGIAELRQAETMNQRIKSGALPDKHLSGVYADAHGRVPLKIKAAYAAPQFSILSLTILVTVYFTPFYEKCGANLAFVAFYTAVARAFDVVTDPAMGFISDNTRCVSSSGSSSTTSHCSWFNPFVGRRRPYMFVGAVGFALSFVCLANPPLATSETDIENNSVSSSVWFGFFYVMFYLFDTVRTERSSSSSNSNSKARRMLRTMRVPQPPVQL